MQARHLVGISLVAIHVLAAFAVRADADSPDPSFDCRSSPGDEFLRPDSALRSVAVGVNGRYGDRCDDSGNLLEYFCESRRRVCPRSSEWCPLPVVTGEVEEVAVDCAGHCSSGRCPARCPAHGDRLVYELVDGRLAVLRNLSDDRSYHCSLIFDDLQDSFSCEAQVAPGREGVVAGFGFYGPYGQYFCSGEAFGSIAVDFPELHSLGSECGYRCGDLRVEPEPVLPPPGAACLVEDERLCVRPGDRVTFLEVGRRRAWIHDATLGSVLECRRRRGREPTASVRAGDEAQVRRARERCEGDARLRVDLRHPEAGTLSYCCDAPSRPAPGVPERCTAGAPSAGTVSLIRDPEFGLQVLGAQPGIRHTAVSDEGSFTDQCNDRGNLVEYSCEALAERRDFDIVGYTETGRVQSNPINCGGHCRDGACPSHCPAFFDELEVLAAGAGRAQFRNRADGRLYECELRSDSVGIPFDCDADLAPGSTLIVDSLHQLPSGYCTAGSVGALGSSELGCSYECALAE